MKKVAWCIVVAFCLCLGSSARAAPEGQFSLGICIFKFNNFYHGPVFAGTYVPLTYDSNDRVWRGGVWMNCNVISPAGTQAKQWVSFTVEDVSAAAGTLGGYWAITITSSAGSPVGYMPKRAGTGSGNENSLAGVLWVSAAVTPEEPGNHFWDGASGRPESLSPHFSLVGEVPQDTPATTQPSTRPAPATTILTDAISQRTLPKISTVTAWKDQIVAACTAAVGTDATLNASLKYTGYNPSTDGGFLTNLGSDDANISLTAPLTGWTRSDFGGTILGGIGGMFISLKFWLERIGIRSWTAAIVPVVVYAYCLYKLVRCFIEAMTATVTGK